MNPPRPSRCLLAWATLLALLLLADEAPAADGVERDLVYARVGERDLRLDLYRPSSPAPSPPLVVWIHGGAWQSGAKEPCPLAWLSEHGYAVASLAYRLTPEAPFPAQIHDVKGAIRWLRAHAARLGLEATQIGVAGGSAGGHLAALLGTGGGVAALEGQVGGYADASSRVQAVYDLFGPSDLERFLADGGRDAPLARGVLTRLLAGPPEERADLARLASPVAHVTSDDPPFLIVHGASDGLVPVAQSERLDAALRAAGVESTLVVIPGAGHGGPEFQTEALRARVRAFFDRTLRGSGAAPGPVASATVPGEGSALARVRTATRPGPHRVQRTDLSLEDRARKKTLPLAVTFPLLAASCPVIVFSHGAFGSKDNYRPLAEHWASHGYVVVQPTHEDSLALGRRLARLVQSPFRHWASRVADVVLVLDRLANVQAALPGFPGTLDRARIGVGGHSFGAHTSQLLAGATTRTAGSAARGSHADPRPKAFLLISPQGRGDLLDEQSWASIDRPLCVITGTNDTGRGGQTFVWRTEPYVYAPRGDKVLAVLLGAHHGFGGIAGAHRFPGSGPADATQVTAVKALGLLFFDATLRADPAARAALDPTAFDAAFPDLVRLTHGG